MGKHASIVIRIATKQDAEVIADISQQTFIDSFKDQNKKENIDKFINEQFTKPRLMEEVGAPNNIFLLAYKGSKLAGYVRLRENNNPPQLQGLETIEVARLYAITEMIGKGVGKALMEESIAIAKAKGKQVIWLGVWEENERAFSFYTRFGFKKFAEHDFILGDEVQKDWLLKKEL